LVELEFPDLMVISSEEILPVEEMIQPMDIHLKEKYNVRNQNGQKKN